MSSLPSTSMLLPLIFNSVLHFTGDPDLTQQGILDAMNIHARWEEEKKANIGLPQLSYCSPLSRALLTNTITFGTEVYYDSDQAPEITTIIVEVSHHCLICFQF